MEEYHVLHFKDLNTGNNFSVPLKSLKKASEYVEYAKKNGIVLHNEKGPAWLMYSEISNKKDLNNPYKAIHYQNGEKKKEIKYDYLNSKLDELTYYKNNKIHNENGPAQIKYFPSGCMKSEIYFKNNEIHREDGPAIVRYLDLKNIPDNVVRKYWKAHEWWQNGVPHGGSIERNWDTGKYSVSTYKNGRLVNTFDNQTMDPKLYIKGKILELHVLAQQNDLDFQNIAKEISQEIDGTNADYKILVGGVGFVEAFKDVVEAEDAFDKYAHQSKSEQEKYAGRNVFLVDSQNEVIKEHVGSLEQDSDVFESYMSSFKP